MKLFPFFSEKRVCQFLPVCEGQLVEKYRHFRALLQHNHDALRALAELQQFSYIGAPPTRRALREAYEALLESVYGLVLELNAVADGAYAELETALAGIDESISALLKFSAESMPAGYALHLDELSAPRECLVGAKAMNLAVLKNELRLPVPEGFVMSARASKRFLEQDGLRTFIDQQLSGLEPEDFASIERASDHIVQRVRSAEIPAELLQALSDAYTRLESRTEPNISIALRSSAIGEDSDASFAGQYASVLGVGPDGIADAYRFVMASKYSPRAIAYRLRTGLDEDETPMCVLGLAMVDAASSGVLYTSDPIGNDDDTLSVSALWGIGEQLVSGAGVADTYRVRKSDAAITGRTIAPKTVRLLADGTGELQSQTVTGEERLLPALSDDEVAALTNYGIAAELHYGQAMDMEWARDQQGRIYLLQARPLHRTAMPADLQDTPSADEHPVIIDRGEVASAGLAAGPVHIMADTRDLGSVPAGAIVITKTASPAIAAIMGSLAAIIAESGSVTSHLAAVAREYGVPMLVHLPGAMTLLANESSVSVKADRSAAIYRGMVASFQNRRQSSRVGVVSGAARKRLDTLLNLVEPLTLTDTRSAAFTPSGCRTIHDIIRFCHEKAVTSMFGISGDLQDAAMSVKLTTHLPVGIRCADLGGGLRKGLTTCDTITPDDVASLPFRALWRGFSHPGVSWEGTVNFEQNRLMKMLATTATSEFGEEPGGESYALLGHDYLNLSMKFGYHFTTVDALCTDDANQNYVSLEFAGGAGSLAGRSLRVQFLAQVLQRLNFEVSVRNDMLDASLGRVDADDILAALDPLGRLLASSRLLDMALKNRDDVQRCADAFFAGNYDFLSGDRPDLPASFYVHLGNWRCVQEDGATVLEQDGSQWGLSVARWFSGIASRTFGRGYQEMLDSIGAFFYFPLAIARDSECADSFLSARVLPVSGNIDQAGGIAFGIRNIANYFVFRINPLEENAMIYEYVNGERLQRATIDLDLPTGQWHDLHVRIAGQSIAALLNGEQVLEYSAAAPIAGHVGLWTKADAVIRFGPLSIEDAGGVRTFGCQHSANST